MVSEQTEYISYGGRRRSTTIRGYPDGVVSISDDNGIVFFAFSEGDFKKFLKMCMRFDEKLSN